MPFSKRIGPPQGLDETSPGLATQVTPKWVAKKKQKKATQKAEATEKMDMYWKIGT